MSRGGTPTSTLSLVRVIVLLCCAFVPEDGASGQSTSASGLVVGDYCERERFEASCAPDEVILIHWAVYGRMKLGRCVRLEYGAIKCSVNVLPLVDSRCSGRQTCKFHTSDLHTVSPCPSELVAYLEASYECIKITTCESGICEAGSFLRVPTAAGYLASSLTLSRGCGSVTCPWVLTPQPGQRFNLTFYNFPATPTELTPGQPMARGRYCQRLAVIVDKFTQVPKDVTICNEHPSPTRTIQFITTESVPVEIKIFGPISIENPTFFIVRYETIGCEDLKTPDGGWTKRDGDLLSVGCDNVQKTWHLTCDGVRWIGDIGTCDTDADKTGTNQALNAGTSLNTQSSSTHGLLLVVGIGVVLGIVLGFSMLAVAVLLLKRRRHYMAKQQLREACMTQLTGNDDLLSVNNLYNHHQGSSAMTYSDKQPVSAAAFVCPDSGLYYHTYQSRDLFAVSSSVKMAAAATSATMPSSMTSASKGLPPPPPPPTTCNLEPKAITILS